MIARAGKHAQYPGQQKITGHDAYGIAETPVRGDLAAARIGLVYEVVVQQRGSVEHLHRHGDGETVALFCFQQPGSQQRQARPDALATCLDQRDSDVTEQARVASQFCFELLVEELQVTVQKLMHSGDYTVW